MEASAPRTEDQEPGTHPTIYPAREYGTVDVPLEDIVDSSGSLELNPEVEAKGYFTIQLTKGLVRLMARGFVGQIPLNDRVIIDVEPRVPVANRGRLLRVSGYIPPFLSSERSYGAEPTWNESLVDLYAEWLATRIDFIASEGLLRGYERREEESSFPRGRIRTDATLIRLRPRGIQHRVVSSWFERTLDNPANRCMKYAIWFIAGRLAKVGPRTASRRRLLQRLSVLYEVFASVPLDHSLGFLDDPVVTGARSLPSLRHYYRPALALSAVMIRNHAIDAETKQNALELPTTVLDMDTIFESYLRNILRREATSAGWALDVLDGNKEGKKLLFDAPPSEHATPDIVCQDTNGNWSLVLEVKNVPVKGNSKRDAIEQVVTYATSYRCGCVVLVHPRGHHQQAAGLRLQGEIDGLAIYQYVFDLGADKLSSEEEAFAESMFNLSLRTASEALAR